MSGPKYVPGWQGYEHLVRALFNDLQSAGKLTSIGGIVPIARGGLVPAAILANLANIPIVDVITVTSYHNGIQHQARIQHLLAQETRWRIEYGNILFVDDLVDTGLTLKAIQHHYGKIKAVAPLGKVSGVEAVKHLLLTPPKGIVDDNVWVEFPWE